MACCIISLMTLESTSVQAFALPGCSEISGRQSYQAVNCVWDGWWARGDLNTRSTDYESGALAGLSYGPTRSSV